MWVESPAGKASGAGWDEGSKGVGRSWPWRSAWGSWTLQAPSTLGQNRNGGGGDALLRAELLERGQSQG